MAKDTIKCPKCGEVIPISSAIAHEIEEDLRREAEKDKTRWRKELEAKEAELREKYAKAEEALRKEQEKREGELQKGFEAERKKHEDRIRKDIEERGRLDLEDLRAQLREASDKARNAEDAELELRKKTRELEDRQKTMDLEMERRLDEARKSIEAKARDDFADAQRLKDADKDKLINDLKGQVDDLKRKIEQGSQKIQGEVLELELENELRREFPFDVLEPISSGIRGADILQHVKTQAGRESGKILWETKRTQNWSDGWIQKVKDDQREAKADVAVIVSEALPKGLRHFRQISGVWVTDVPTVVSFAAALRFMLIQVTNTKIIQTGKEEKMGVVYSYVTGPEFRNRVQAIIESYVGLKSDLDAERRAMERIWAKREKKIEQVVRNISGMRGDLEGIAGKTLPSIQILELPEGDEEEQGFGED